MQGPGMLPPTFVQQAANPWGFNSYGYNWWDYAQQTSVDPKVSRIAYNLAGHIVKDRLKQDNLQKIKDMKVKFLDFANDGDLASLLESLGLKLDVVRGADIPFNLMNNKLEPNQIVIINSLYVGQPKEVFQNIFNYVNDGGRLMIFNSSPQLVSAIFPGKIHPAPHSICVSAKLKITGDKELFSAYGPVEDVALEYGRYPIDIIDKKGVEVLAKIQAHMVEPLLVRFTHGNGAVFFFISKIFTKERETDDFAKQLESKGASKETVSAWQCAVNVNYKNAVSLAFSAFPSMELIAKILLKENIAIEQINAIMVKMMEQQRQKELEEQQNSETQNAENSEMNQDQNMEQDGQQMSEQ